MHRIPRPSCDCAIVVCLLSPILLTAMASAQAVVGMAMIHLPEVVPDSFDVIFFVKRTTPARKNPKLPKVIDPDFIRV